MAVIARRLGRSGVVMMVGQAKGEDSMATANGGQVRPYGVAISDALADPASSLEDLNALRDRARRELDEQGDLPGALARLEEEIKRRGGGAQPAGGLQPLYAVSIHD